MKTIKITLSDEDYNILLGLSFFFGLSKSKIIAKILRLYKK